MTRLWTALIATMLIVAGGFVTAPETLAGVAPDDFGFVDPSSGIWYLYQDGQQAVPFFFGNPGDYPFMGDWDGDGIDTPGLYRQSDGFAYLRNDNSQGNADISFFFGNPGDIPIIGDFNNDGFDTVSIYRPSSQTFYIINELGEDGGGLGEAEFSYVFGNPGDKPFVGDFDGDGTDTVGLHRESTGLVYYLNTHAQGNADNQFIFGNPDDRFVAGDWTGNGADSPGLFRPGSATMYLRYENSQGNANESWNVGQGHWLPVAGQFGNIPFPPPLAKGAGTGDGVVAIGIPNVPVVIELTHDGSSNFIVWSLDHTFSKVDLLVNEIGAYEGTRPMQFDAHENVSRLEISADGHWAYEVRPLSLEPRQSCPVTGAGDSVIVLPRFESAAGTASLTHSGSSNFIVWAWGSNDRDLLVNEIGPYSGTVVVSSGLSAWDISADGAWTVSC